jgi:hypothetical protein
MEIQWDSISAIYTLQHTLEIRCIFCLFMILSFESIMETKHKYTSDNEAKKTIRLCHQMRK